jgi:hypothetical protein
MRFIVDITYMEGNGVEGLVSREGRDEPQRFFGWLELTRLLEAPRCDRGAAEDS